jgi:hypothetical protein
MRLALAAAVLVTAIVSTASSDAAERQPKACADPPSAPDASSAFEAYCGRCHNAGRLAKSYFEGADAKEASRRQALLAVFLNRHSACPHQHHEAIAAWLRELSTRN